MSESCVFGDPTWQSEQPKAAAVTGGKKKRKKKSTEGERDPDLAGFAAASNGDGWRGRKEENGNDMKRNEETRELRRESKSRKNKVTAGELVPGHAGSLERFPASRSPFCTQMRWTYCSGSEK